MEKVRVGYAGGSCNPYESGTVMYSSELFDGLRMRHTVTVTPSSGYKFVRWEFDIPELWEGAEFDSGSLSSIESQSNSQTIVWNDPERFDTGYGIRFIAHMIRQDESTGEIIHGETHFPIFGKNGTLLFKG